MTQPASEIGAVLSPDFRFGVATSAYQIEGGVYEGGRGESIWDRFCERPGVIDNDETGEVTSDHYHRWRDDLDLMKDLGLETYRFSIAWPRVQPQGRGQLNQEGVSFYRRLAEGLLERGIEPVATLYHWDLPQALQDEGGWTSRETAERFAAYAAQTCSALGDLITSWITHNEPWVTAFRGHAEGTKAPGMSDWPTAIRVSHHLLLSHGLAVEALRAADVQAEVGISLNLAPVRPASSSAADLAAARRRDGELNRWFLDPILVGRYPDDMTALYLECFGHFGRFRRLFEDDLQTISVPIDFLGVNYYFPERVRANAGAHPLGYELLPPSGSEPTAMGWEVDPRGLYEILTRLHDDYQQIPIWITENGAAYDDHASGCAPIDDPKRLEYLKVHLEALGSAIDAGVDVRRYHVWSLIDNFEWERGYAKRFGLVYVDYETQARILKHSGIWYRDYIAGVRKTVPVADVTGSSADRAAD